MRVGTLGNMSNTPLLDNIKSPQDLRGLTESELCRLAEELRSDTIAIVSETGGHLGSSLGVVELTVALHAVFNTPYDKLIWDVSHQCYPHKILTGRRDKMRTLRKKGGLSGFTKRSESEFDPFGAAHSSTSISAALGFTVAHDFGEQTGESIAVIGDGSISAGMAYEALNNAGAEGRRMFVILNDNEMSIAPPVGAMSKYLSSLYSSSPLHSIAELAEDLTKNLPSPLREGARRAKSLVTGLAGGNTFFEELGFSYVGPIDGHDVNQLLSVLRAVRIRAKGPVLIHCITKKGKGYNPAELADDKYHGVAKFDVVSGAQQKSKPNAPSYTSVFGKALLAEAERDPKVIAVTAAMPSGTGVDIMSKQFPKRVFDVGIAEQHAVTFSGGMAAGGLKPFCAIYSTFLQSGYDQIVHDVALQNLPVRFAVDRAGLVGADGPTHAGSYDIAYLTNLPNMVVMAASDEAELVHMVATAAAYNDGPIAFRYPRGEGVGVDLPKMGIPIKIGKGRLVQKGEKVAILSFGTHLSNVLAAAEILKDKGIILTIADARFSKPLDIELIQELVNTHEALITVEEGAKGGFGAHVLHWLAETGNLDKGLKIRTLTLKDEFIDQASPSDMYIEAGLDTSAIVDCVADVLNIEKISEKKIKIVK